VIWRNVYTIIFVAISRSMNRSVTLIAILSVALLFGACSGSKSFSKKAKKLQEAGLVDEASDFYYQALLRNPQNVDAKIGLKQTGAIQLNKKLDAFYKAYSLEKHGEAVYLYQDAMDLQKLYAPFVDVPVAPYYDEYYNESLNTYLKARYEVATEYVYEQKYEEADKIFKEIIKLKPDYEDAQSMAEITTIEPIYMKGVESFEAGKYRQAYTLFEQVQGIKGDYKDAIDYRQMALDEARVNVAVVPFEDATGKSKTLDEKLYTATVQSLLNTNDPFIKLIDRGNTDAILQEQKRSLEAGGDLDVSVMEDANIIITGKILSYEQRGGQVKSQRKPGYESYRVKEYDAEKQKSYYVTKYRKTSYTEYSGSSELYCTFKVEMVNTETGEILASELLTSKSRDAVNYAQYKGNYKNLYRGSYKSSTGAMVAGDKVFTSYKDKQQLDQKFTTSRKSLKSFGQLGAEVSTDLSKQISYVVTSYNPEK